MNDSQVAPTDPAASKKSPLDVLEEILEDSKSSKSQIPNPKSQNLGDQADQTQVQAEPAIDPAEEARKAAEIEAQKQADQQAIAIKQQEIESMKQSSQYQAVQSQKQDEAIAQAQQQDFMKGNEIRQLIRKKVEVTE